MYKISLLIFCVQCWQSKYNSYVQVFNLIKKHTSATVFYVYTVVVWAVITVQKIIACIMGMWFMVNQENCCCLLLLHNIAISGKDYWSPERLPIASCINGKDFVWGGGSIFVNNQLFITRISVTAGPFLVRFLTYLQISVLIRFI